ncbi:MAG: GTP-binding protein, partial [bacterium]
MNLSETVKIVVVGHVDHGKSTLIGRLFYDTGSIPEVRMREIEETCARQGRPFEFAYLLDALEEEQDHNVTIDTCQTFFKTEKRPYVIIDAPGHVEFLKNMITGAASADAAILVLDGIEGVREQTRRHAYLLSLLGIRQVIVAVNKLDMAGYDRRIFQEAENAIRNFLNP